MGDRTGPRQQLRAWRCGGFHLPPGWDEDCDATDPRVALIQSDQAASASTTREGSLPAPAVFTRLTLTEITAADIATYLVNLRRRSDRRERMRAILPPELKATFTSDWDGPFDVHQLSRSALEAAGYRTFPWQIDSDNPWWGRPLKLGEIG